MLKTRKLGKTGVSVSSIGLGCMGMSEYYGPSDDQSSVALLRKAVDLGITLFDTADMYGVGHNEMLLAQAFRGALRDKVVIATKFANMRRIDGAYLGVNGRPEYVKAACDMSLKRLGVKHIDLYYQHRVDPEVPIEETVGAMAELVKEGKVRFLGLSEAGAKTIRRAHAVHPITALQTEYSSVDPGRRGGDPRHLPRAGHQLCRLQPPGPRFSHRCFQAPAPIRREGFPEEQPPDEGGQFRAEQATCGEDRRNGRKEGLHRGAARPCLGSLPGRRRDPDSRHPPGELPQGQHRGDDARAFQGRAGSAGRASFSPRR